MKNLPKFSFKNTLVAVSALAIIAAVSATGISNLLDRGPEVADAYFPGLTVNFPVNVNGSIKTMKADGISESLSHNGVYAVSYRISNPSHEDASFPIRAASHKCPMPHGHTSTDGLRAPVCEMDSPKWETFQINLNAGNNWTQDIHLSIQQDYNQPCGTFQTDLFSNTKTNNIDDLGFFIASIHFTEKDLATCIPTPSPSPSPVPSPSLAPSPSPSVAPSPSPSVKPSPKPSKSPSTQVQCEFGKVPTIKNSQIICVEQNQSQTSNNTNNNENNNNNTNKNNNTQNQTNNQNVNVTANGGNGGSSSSSSSVTVNNNVSVTQPSATPVVAVNGTTPQVISKGDVEVKELPKTGLPLAALALPALAPLGLRLRKSGKSQSEVSANSIWMEKQVNS